MDMKKEKNAFTLAETLLTIMIIGILVALMLRAINRVNPDKDKVLFLKAYHAIRNTKLLTFFIIKPLACSYNSRLTCCCL